MEMIPKPKQNMTKEELFEYLWQLAQAVEFNEQDADRRLREVENNAD